MRLRNLLTSPASSLTRFPCNVSISCKLSCARLLSNINYPKPDDGWDQPVSRNYKRLERDQERDLLHQAPYQTQLLQATLPENGGIIDEIVATFTVPLSLTLTTALHICLRAARPYVVSKLNSSNSTPVAARRSPFVRAPENCKKS